MDKQLTLTPAAEGEGVKCPQSTFASISPKTIIYGHALLRHYQELRGLFIAV